MTHKANFLKEKLNILYYAYKRNNWMFDLSRYFKEFNEIKINKPIFFLGTHGGGLTLVSRMLRRNKKVVSVSGDYNYWSGADEMQVVYGPILPFEFSGIKHKVPYHFKFKKHTSWLYATENLIDKYRLTEKDVTSELKDKFRKILRWTIKRNGQNIENVRFTDKSQVFTVKLSFINEILKDTDPKFILITRNPYAVCYRAPKKAGGMKKIRNRFTYEELVDLAAQHWSNSMKYVLEDKDKVDNFLWLRFEDILLEPEKNMKKICDFVDLEYNNLMLPQLDDEIPFGSRFNKKWYPLRPNVNQKYLEKIEEKYIDIIDKHCSEYAKLFDYAKPK